MLVRASDACKNFEDLERNRSNIRRDLLKIKNASQRELIARARKIGKKKTGMTQRTKTILRIDSSRLARALIDADDTLRKCNPLVCTLGVFAYVGIVSGVLCHRLSTVWTIQNHHLPTLRLLSLGCSVISLL